MAHRPPQIYDQDAAAQARRMRASREGPPQVGRGRRPSASPPRPGSGTGGVGVWRRRNGWVISVIVLVGSLAGLGALFLSRNADTGTAPTATGDVAGVQFVSPGPRALLVQVDDGGAAQSFTVVALDGDDAGAVVFVPLSTMVEIPGFGLDELWRAVELGGVDLAALTVRNLLSVDFEHVVTLTPAGLSALTEPLGPLSVDNPDRVDRETDDGRVVVVWPQGRVVVEPARVADFLALRGAEQSELERLVRHQALWEALLDGRRSTTAGDDGDAATDVDAFLDATATRLDRIGFSILPVESLGGPAELYGVDRTGLADLMSRIDPGGIGDGGDRIRVQLLNGVGVPGLAEPVTELLLAAGVSVELTGNALRFDHEVTQIVYYHDSQIDDALRVRDQLGVGDVVKQRDPIDVVDITVVVGSDLVARLGTGAVVE